MKIVKPYARLLEVPEFNNAPILMDGTMQKIEWCGRISHRSEDAQAKESWKRFIKAVVLDHGDWSIVEHASASVDMLVDRGITHELVRHRLFSFTQESTRFVRYFKEKAGDIVNPAVFIYPITEVECKHCLAGDESHYASGAGWLHSDGQTECAYEVHWLDAIEQAEHHYKSLLNKGWKPQQARSVLPNALASRIVVTGNLRNWRHLFIMRTTQETHPQFRQVTIPLLAEFQQAFPILFDDIVPMQKQSEAMKKAR